MIEAVDGAASEALAALHACAFDRPWSVSEIAKLLENPAAFAFIAREAAPVGFVMAWAVGGEAEVLTVAVAPEARRNGVGAALVAAAAAAAASRGATAIYLEVSEENAAARALYAKLGFTDAGHRPGYYGGGEVNAVIMRRALPM